MASLRADLRAFLDDALRGQDDMEKRMEGLIVRIEQMVLPDAEGEEGRRYWLAELRAAGRLVNKLRGLRALLA